ncbi:LON peptidase substrate-binding domain-containing protein [Achromobacter xylosoxidans]
MSASQTLPSDPIDLPLLPLRDVVVFPHMVIPLFVSTVRARSARWKSRWKRARASCWWRKSPPARMIPLPKTSTKSAASPASCRC